MGRFYHRKVGVNLFQQLPKLLKQWFEKTNKTGR